LIERLARATLWILNVMLRGNDGGSPKKIPVLGHGKGHVAGL
jgi:hypothetical protein